MLLAPCCFAQAQQQTKIARIGFLSATSDDARVDAFRQGLRELGYVEGQNIAIEYRWAAGNFARLPELAAELVALKVDTIVAVVTQASLAAKKATPTIPIVMAAVGNPVEAGLIANLARPGANLTGTSTMNDEVVGKQLELLKKISPKISRVAALWNPANQVFQKLQLREADAAAQALNLKLQKLEARNLEEIERAFAAIAKERTRALHVISDPVFTFHRKQVSDLAVKHRLPAVGAVSEFAEAGLLLSYGPNFPESFRRAAIYVDKILKGAKPADLPVERSRKFDLVINLHTAQQIGVTVPQSVLLQAERVIK